MVQMQRLDSLEMKVAIRYAVWTVSWGRPLRSFALLQKNWTALSLPPSLSPALWVCVSHSLSLCESLTLSLYFPLSVCLSLPLSIYLSLTYTHTRTHARTHARTHTDTAPLNQHSKVIHNAVHTNYKIHDTRIVHRVIYHCERNIKRWNATEITKKSNEILSGNYWFVFD